MPNLYKIYIFTNILQMRKLEFSDSISTGCSYYAIEQRIRPSVLDPQGLILSIKHKVFELLPFTPGHFKNRREIELTKARAV